ncbi:LOW QUALITY PROTEIN: COMM domain-containing protein 5 [Calonectris borealis]|uniref:LOW QUALITY PROTEIN: COMM domain-containing protein 5 n=1 Tax=Calonectris borealis TaxID=1323832 RepID=UPI003F4B7E34
MAAGAGTAPAQPGGAGRGRAPHARSGRAAGAAMSCRSRDAPQSRGPARRAPSGAGPPRRDSTAPPAAAEGGWRPTRARPQHAPPPSAPRVGRCVVSGRRGRAAMAAAVGKAAGAAYGHGESGGGRGGGFLGPRVPAEVEAMARGVQDVGKETFRRLLKVTVNALEGKDCKESVKLIAESTNLSEEQLAFLISGMYTLLREALRLPLSTFKQEVFKEDLKELRIPEDFIVDFSSIVFGNRRPPSEGTALIQGSRLPSVQDFKWRVDVAISTSSLARALQPSILMMMKLSDGTAHRFEVPVAKFQELRYNVALILKEMNDLEKRSILKIQD